MAKRNMFTSEFVNSPDALASECVKEPFPTNGDRISAAEIAKRNDVNSFTLLGFITQAIVPHPFSLMQIRHSTPYVSAILF